MNRLIFIFVTLVSSAFADAAGALPIERQLVREIFGPCWGLNANESEMLLGKLRIARGRSNYEKVLQDLYILVSNLTPKPFNPSLWHDEEDALAVEPTHRVLIENSDVRILEVVIPPGHSQAYHTHKWAGITLDLIPSDFILTNGSGEFLLSATDDPVWHHDEGQPLHKTTNISDAVTYVGLHFELKN